MKSIHREIIETYDSYKLQFFLHFTTIKQLNRKQMR